MIDLDGVLFDKKIDNYELVSSRDGRKVYLSLAVNGCREPEKCVFLKCLPNDKLYKRFLLEAVVLRCMADKSSVYTVRKIVRQLIQFLKDEKGRKSEILD